MRLLFDEVRAAGLFKDGLDDMLVPYEITDAAAWYWQAKEVMDPVKGHMGPLRPGYPATWWEYTMPRDIWSHHPGDGGPPGWRTSQGDERYGFAVVCGEPEPMTATLDKRGYEVDLNGPPLVLMISVYIAGRSLRDYTGDAPVAPFPAMLFAPITETGGWSTWTERNRRDVRIVFHHRLADRLHPFTVEIAPVIVSTVEGMFAGLGLSNCKNVRTVERQVPAKVAAKRARKLGAPATSRYRVVELPGRSGHTVSGRADGPVRASRLHPVRGHLKHYGPEKPLLGRAVGTFWWADHVRGATVEPAPGDVAYRVRRTPGARP